MGLIDGVHRDTARISSPRSPGPTINEGPCAEVGSVSMATATQRSFDVQELTTTSANQLVSSSADHNNALALVAPGGNHVVARCIDLLQTDPDIQVLSYRRPLCFSLDLKTLLYFIQVV